MINQLKRAQGALLGQLIGDSLGSLVEFQSAETIRRAYPNGVRNLEDGGTWDTLAGQPTDDSEMALMLARSLVKQRRYDPEAVYEAYRFWLQSKPFDCGNTTYAGLSGHPNPDSQANGALMRISPLGIFGSNHASEDVMDWARQDAALTHPNPVCQEANALYAAALAMAVKEPLPPQMLYAFLCDLARSQTVPEVLSLALLDAKERPPQDYARQQGWVVIAFQNAFYQLLHAPSLEEGIVDTVMRGGDTDTNAAICGALLGASYGVDAIPERWVSPVLSCRPQAGASHVKRPRPECFWPVDALSLAEALIQD